jgi:hypothetical protein
MKHREAVLDYVMPSVKQYLFYSDKKIASAFGYPALANGSKDL